MLRALVELELASLEATLVGYQRLRLLPRGQAIAETARFCVISVSKEYKSRVWTTHELRSALARAVEERGRAYILPVEVERVDLDGLPPTVKAIPASQYSPQQIGELLIKKLGGTVQGR